MALWRAKIKPPVELWLVNLNGNTDIVLSDTVQEIGRRAFDGCTALTSISCSNVQEIGEEAFKSCINLRSIVCPNVLKIGRRAFEGCTNLTNISCPNVQGIDGRVFEGCTNLTDISCPNVQEINKQAFEGCNNLTYINLGNYFKSYNDFAKSGHFSSDQKVVIALTLMATKQDWGEEEKKKYQAYLSRGAKELVCKMIYKEDMQGLMLCEQAGLLTKRRIDGFVEYASEKGKVAVTAYLMNYKHEHFPVK